MKLLENVWRYHYLERCFSQEKLQLQLFCYNFDPRKWTSYMAVVVVPSGKTPLTPSKFSNKDEFTEGSSCMAKAAPQGKNRPPLAR